MKNQIIGGALPRLLAIFVACCGVTGAAAANFLGSGTETFDTLPAADAWSTLSIGNTHEYTTQELQDAAIQRLAPSNITTVVGNSVLDPPGASPIAQWSSTGHYLQTRPTGNGASLLMATLRNDSGRDVTNLVVRYDLALANVAGFELIAGHRIYYNLTGSTNGWVPVGDFGTPGPQNISADLSGAPWIAGARLYLLWADNDTASDPDGAYQIDNVSVNQTPMLQWSRNSNTGRIVISWTGSATLQQTFELGPTATWNNVTTTNSYSFTPPSGMASTFFRLR